MEEPKSITQEMFEKLGIETKPAEVEKTPLKESEEAIESCETSDLEKCKGNELSEPVGFVADAKLIIDEIQSTYSQKEILKADDSLSKETENEEQLAKSPPPALDESTTLIIDTLNPSETILESSAEQRRQNMEASAAQVEEVQSQLSETSNYSGELVGDVEDDVSSKRDDFSTEILESKIEGVETSTKTSLLKVEDQNYHIISDANVEASNLSREDKEHEKFSCVAHQALEGDRTIATSAEDDNLEDNVSNKKEDPQSTKDEMFNKLGVEAKVDEIEESPLKELVEATKFCETNLEKCKNNILSEPVESAADGNLVTGDIQSTFFKTEMGIADDSLSKKTENQQLAESPPPALKENNVSVTDSEKPTETILKTSAEEDNQKMEASTAKVEEIHPQLKEVSNFLGARVVEKRDEFTGTSTEGSDDKTEGIKTDPETSTLEVEDQDDHTKSAKNVGASDLSRSEDKEEDEKFINLAHRALEEDMNIGKRAEDDNLEDRNLNKTEEPQRFKGETLDKDGIEAETADMEQNLSKEVETIELCETNLEKLKDSVPSEPVELAANVNLIVSEVQSSHDGSCNKASLEEHEAPFDKIQTDKRTENEDSSEGDHCGKPSEVETKANPEEEKLEITKVDELLDVSELLPSEEKTQAVAEKTSYEIVNPKAVLKEKINEVVDKSFTNSKEDAEKKNVTQTEGLATETSESGNNGKDIPVFEPKPQANLGVSEEQSHVPEILQECQNKDLENQKSQTMGESCELDTRDENKKIVEAEQLTEKSCQPNEKSSSGGKLDNHVNDTLHSGSSTGGLDVSNKYSSVDEIYGEEALKQSGDGDSVNELANEMAIEHSVPQQEESINEDINFTAVATEGGSVKSCEGSNKEHDEEDVVEPVTINKGQSTHSQNETPISDDSLSGETGNELLAKPPPLALNVHTISVTDSEKPTEPILGTSMEEDVQSIEPSAAKVEEIHYESSKHSGTEVIETKDDVSEKKEFSAERSYNKIASEIDNETILSEEKNDQTTCDENERIIVKSEEEEKDDKFSNIATEALEKDMNTVTKTEDVNPEDNNSNSKWNERTLDLEEPKKETQKGEEVSTTFIDDQNNETSESLLVIREDVKSEKEENLVNDKKLEEGYKLNSEDKLVSVDAKVNVVEKEDSATNLQKGAASEEFHHETPEKYKIQSKEDKINMLDADGKTSIDDLHVEAPKPQVEASNTLPIEQDFMTVATPHVIESESSVDVNDSKNLNNALEANIRPAQEIDKGLSEMHLDSTDFKESKLIQQTVEAKEDMEMEKLEKQYESASTEPNHEDSSDEQYPIIEITIDKEFADEMVQNVLPVQVSEDVEEVSISEPIIHTKEIDFVNESIMNPASVEAEKEGSIDVREISDCEGHIDDDQLTLESEESIESQGASLASLTSEHVHIEDASASAQDSTKMKEVCSRSDPEETTFPTEPAEDKEQLVQDDERLMIANRDQSAEIQKPDEDENKEDFDKNLVQDEQAELIPQEVKSSDEVMASQKMTDGQQQVHDIIDNITIKLDPSKVKQDSGAAPSENNVAEIQNTSAMGDKNSTFGDLSGKHNYDEIELFQSTEGHELESVVEGSCQEQPTHVNEVIEETTDKWEETTEPQSIKTDEKLNDPNKTPEVEDQHEATMILQGVAKDESTTSTTIIDPEEKECDSRDNSFSNKKDEENQDASAIVDQISTIADTDKLQNNETASIELTERKKAENSVGGYPDEQHANDATKETGDEDSIRHEELTTDHSIEKEQNNEVATEIGDSGSMGNEELSIEKEQNLRKQTLSMEVEDIQETVTPQCVTEDKQLPEQITDMTKELDTDEKEQYPVTAISETALEDSFYSKKDDDSKDDLATLVGTGSIRDDDEKYQDEEQPINWTKRNAYESTTEGIAEEQPIQASEVTVEAGASGLISYGTVPEDLASGFLEKEETGDSAKADGAGTMEAEDEKHGDKKMSIKLTEINEKETIVSCSEEEKVRVSEVPMDAGERGSRRYEEITQHSSMRHEELVEEPSTEEEEILSRHTLTMEMECVQKTLAPQAVHEDKQLPEQITDVTKELNTQEKEQYPITASADIAMEDSFSSKKDEDKKGNLATINGISSIEDDDEKHRDEEQPIKLPERNEYEDVVEGRHEEQQIHVSEVTVKGGESDLISYEEVPEHHFIEKEENLSKQTTTLEVTDSHSPKRVLEIQQPTGNVTGVTIELDHVGKELNVITTSSEIAVKDFTSNKEDDADKTDSAKIDGTGIMGAENEKLDDEKQSLKLTEINEHETTLKSCPEEEQICAGESGSRSYDESIQHPSIEKEQALIKPTTVVEVMYSRETITEERVTEDQQLARHATEVTSEFGQDKNELNFVSTTSETTLEDYVSEKEDVGNSVKVDGIGSMGDEDDKNGDEDRLEDHQICASEVTTEAGHSGSMRYDELTKHHPVEKEQTTSKFTNSQDAHALERVIEDQQPIEHISDESAELDQEEKEQNFVTASSETALEDTFGNQEEEREGASAPVDDLGSIGDVVRKHGDKEKPMECAERNTLGMMAETDLEKHPANPKEITPEAGDVDLMVCGETAENNLTDKDMLNEPPITLMVEQNIHKKEEESIHVASDEGECTRSEHVKNNDQMLDREVIINQPEKLKLNVTTDDVLVDKSSQADSKTEHTEERRNQEVNISDSTIGEKNTETTAATITEVESCANKDSEKLDSVEHPDGNNKQIDPQDVKEQQEKAPKSETSEEVILDNKLPVDETGDTLGNDGQNVMKEEVASESRIQYMAVPSSGEILEELKAPGILDDTAEHATKKVKDAETSDTLLSQEDLVDDRIQSEENSNVASDACNPDKQISEAEVILGIIKGTNQVEIKDSALEPTDGVSETNLISDALQKADLTKDEDSALKTNDEFTTVTTLTEINTEEKVSDTSKNDLVNEEVNEVIDSAGLMEEGNFKDEKDRAKRELETKVENAETSNFSVEFTETRVEHTDNTEDKAKVWKVEKALTAAMETKIDEATLADKTYTEMPTAEKIISDSISEETKPKEDETSLVSACDTTEEKVEVIEEIEIVSKDIELNKTMGQAQEAQEEVAEIKVDDTNFADNTSLVPQNVETSISDDLVEANGPKHDDSSSVSVPEIIQEGSIKEEEEEIIKRDEGQPQLTVENADTSRYNIESTIKTVLTTEEKEVCENLEEASQLEMGLKSETLIVDETISESTTAETNISDDFVHVGLPGGEEKSSVSGSVSTPGEPMEPKDKSINETSEVFVEELVDEENRKETVEKEKEQDINAENSNSEVNNEDTKSLSADGMDRKHETAYTGKGCSGLSPPEEFTSVVLNEESKPKDEQYSSTSTTETNELIDLSRQLKEEDNLKDALVGFSADKSCKEKEDENVDHCEKIEEKTGLVDSNQRNEATPEKEAQGLPHAKHQDAHLEEQNNGEKQQDKGEEGNFEEDNQVKNTDKNMGKLNPDPVSITSEAPEESLTAVVEEDKLAVYADGEEEKTDEEKEQEAEHEHKEEEPESDAPVMGEASREVNLKPPPKKAHNLLSGVGSKVKHSISKVKKAITGKSSHSKSPAPKSS